MSCPWNAFAREVLSLYAPPIRRIATYRKMRQALEEFGPLCPSTSDLTPTAIAAWVVAHHARGCTTNLSLLKTLRAACTYAMLRGYLTANPFSWRAPTAWVDWDGPEHEPPVHTSAEIAAVLHFCNIEAASGDWKAERLRALVYAYAYTGARKRELLGLAMVDVDLPARAITIRTNRRRGLKTRGSAAALPVAPVLHRVLEHWLPLCRSEWVFPGIRRIAPWLEGPAGAKALDQVKALGLRAGVEGLTIASFRHTFASLSESWGIGETMLQRLLRHSSIRTQHAYRHPLAEGMRDAASKIHFG
jgi:integrase